MYNYVIISIGKMAIYIIKRTFMAKYKLELHGDTLLQFGYNSKYKEYQEDIFWIRVLKNVKN